MDILHFKYESRCMTSQSKFIENTNLAVQYCKVLASRRPNWQKNWVLKHYNSKTYRYGYCCWTEDKHNFSVMFFFSKAHYIKWSINYRSTMSAPNLFPCTGIALLQGSELFIKCNVSDIGATVLTPEQLPVSHNTNGPHINVMIKMLLEYAKGRRVITAGHLYF